MTLTRVGAKSHLRRRTSGVANTLNTRASGTASTRDDTRRSGATNTHDACASWALGPRTHTHAHWPAHRLGTPSLEKKAKIFLPNRRSHCATVLFFFFLIETTDVSLEFVRSLFHRKKGFPLEKLNGGRSKDVMAFILDSCFSFWFTVHSAAVMAVCILIISPEHFCQRAD